jgi:hypothetical protein
VDANPEQSVEVNQLELDEDPEAGLETDAKDSNKVNSDVTNNTADAVDEAGNDNTEKAEDRMDISLDDSIDVDLEAEAQNNLKGSTNGNNDRGEQLSEHFDIDDGFTVKEDLLGIVGAELDDSIDCNVDVSNQAEDDGLDMCDSEGVNGNHSKGFDFDIDVHLQLGDDANERWNTWLGASTVAGIKGVGDWGRSCGGECCECNSGDGEDLSEGRHRL